MGRHIASTKCSFTPLVLKPKPKPETETETEKLIQVRLSFVQTDEYHERCSSVHQSRSADDDHQVILNMPLRVDYLGLIFSFPFEPQHLPFYMACVKVPETLPHYVTPRVWRDVKDKVLEFLFKNVNFDGDKDFEMVAEFQVSKVVHHVFTDDIVSQELGCHLEFENDDEEYEVVDNEYADCDDDDVHDDYGLQYGCDDDDDVYDDYALGLQYGCASSTNLLQRFLTDSLIMAAAYQVGSVC